MALLPVAEALERLLDGAEPAGAETVPLAEAAGRVLAEPVKALRTQPPFDASAMDGYAVRAEDVAASAGAADGHRHGGGRKAVRRHGRQGRGRAHLHRRAGARRRRHDRHPGECREARRRRDRGVRDGRGQAGTSAASGSISPKARCCSKRAACSTPPRFRSPPRRTTRPCRWCRKPLVAIIATGDELLPPGSTPGPGPDHRVQRLWRRGDRAARPARACSISASRPTASRRSRRWSTKALDAERRRHRHARRRLGRRPRSRARRC